MHRAPIGRVDMDRNGRLTFAYDSAYRDDPESTPLSVSMPLAQTEHPHKVIGPWMQNLLPDNAQVLDRWAAQFKVSANSPFALLRHVGRDVAGAAQFVSDDEEHDLEAGGVDWLDSDELTQRLREVRTDPAAWTPDMEAGLFSLAGAQAKLALRHDPKRGWGLPWGAEPTTHILKPYNDQLPHHAMNEHLCLALSYELGLPTAPSEIIDIDGSPVLVVERYDRIAADSTYFRVHQEDTLQAFARGPGAKYEKDGGPSAADIAALLTRIQGPVDSGSDIERFVRALALMWGLGATDAHAKNYSLLLIGADVRLSPLYDVQSAAPYFTGEMRGLPKGRVSIHKAEMAMRVGSHRRFSEVTSDDWRALAEAIGRQDDEVLDLVASTVGAIPDALQSVADAETRRRSTSAAEREFLEHFVSSLTKHAGNMKNALAGRGPAQARKR
ncbi:type II toxin-antitoxin system HipA family toxin [Nocardioides marmoriginsengisoli]|nr:type II toxin-antitoxin system HipA family toxin [Nocardioides marmoriginsengisoli]